MWLDKRWTQQNVNEFMSDEEESHTSLQVVRMSQRGMSRDGVEMWEGRLWLQGHAPPDRPSGYT